jgi:hypothetical protein
VLTQATKLVVVDAQEEFILAKNGETFALLGYHINLMAFMTK